MTTSDILLAQAGDVLKFANVQWEIGWEFQVALSIEQDVIEKIRALSPEQQRTVLDFVKSLKKQAEPSRSTIWEMIRDIVEDVPDEVWDEVPIDGSLNVDHYLYGAPKK